MKRRSFLKIAGGGIIAAAGGAGVFAATRTPQSALMPWSMAGTAQYADPRMNALSWAILAPNPHNRQPWEVELVGDDALILRFDTDRQLPHTDPFDRQLTIGLGCFLELLEMAANTAGYAVERELFPEGSSSEGLDRRPVALVRMRRDAAVGTDPLWRHVPDRRSNKESFDIERPVPESALKSLTATARHGGKIAGTVDPAQIAAWRELTEDALRIEIETPHTYRESVDLFRIGKAEVEANPDGIDFTGPLFESLHMTGMFTREAALDPGSATYKQGLEAVYSNTRTAMGHVWLVTGGNTRADQIAAGGDWLRLNLAATAAGLGIQPLSQALQEYPEMAQIYADVHAQLAPGGGTVQMLARIGYGPKIPVSPRWPIESKVAKA